MGISTIGSGLGTVVIAPIVSFMLDVYGYQGTILIVGALILNNCVAAALYRPVENNFPEKIKTNPVTQDVQMMKHEAENMDGAADNLPEVKTSFLRTFNTLRKIFQSLKNPTFFLYCIEITAMSIAIQTFLTFLPGLAKEYKAANDKEAAFLLSIMGIADMGGRLLIGIPMDLKQVNIMFTSKCRTRAIKNIQFWIKHLKVVILKL